MKIAALTFAAGATATISTTIGSAAILTTEPVNLWGAVVPFALLVSGIGTTIFLTWKISGWVHLLNELLRRVKALEKEQKT